MAATAALVLPASSRMRARTALVASADGSFRQRLVAVLTGLRWQVREAKGGAEAWGEAMEALPQVIIVDSWLPDLDLGEFLSEFRNAFPQVDVVTSSNATSMESAPGPHRQEILYALQRVQETDTAAWNTAPILDGATGLASGKITPMAAHMSNHYEHMNTVTLSNPGTGWNGHDTGRELAQGNERGQGQDNRQRARENSGSMASEPVRQFTNGLQREGASTELPVFTAGMSLQERHFSVVV
jgi:CheY-like chemotaxis protein